MARALSPKRPRSRPRKAFSKGANLRDQTKVRPKPRTVKKYKRYRWGPGDLPFFQALINRLKKKGTTRTRQMPKYMA